MAVQTEWDSVKVCVYVRVWEGERKKLETASAGVCVCISLSPALCKWSWLGCMALGLNLIYELCSNIALRISDSPFADTHHTGHREQEPMSATAVCLGC